jgi:hypothetical protein
MMLGRAVAIFDWFDGTKRPRLKLGPAYNHRKHFSQNLVVLE